MGQARFFIPNLRGVSQAKSKPRSCRNLGKNFSTDEVGSARRADRTPQRGVPTIMKRSFDPAVLEMMDRPQAVSTELERDLERLRQLNRWFGSYRIVSHFGRRWIKPGAQMRVVDLATGSGDIPRLLANYARRIGAQVKIDAVDQQTATLEIA